MGVDHSSVGGIGIKFTEDMKQTMIDESLFTEDEWDDSSEECMEEIGIPYNQAGNSYSGNIEYYFIVNGETLEDVNNNADGFVSKFKKYGINLSVNELKVISEYLVW